MAVWRVPLGCLESVWKGFLKVSMLCMNGSLISHDGPSQDMLSQDRAGHDRSRKDGSS